MSFSKEQIDTLIDLYQERPFLYNNSLKDYHNKQKREIGINDIATVLEISAEEVKKKITSLRTQYSAEHQKVLSSAKSGAGTNNVYTPKWSFYNRLHFLADHITPRRSLSNLSNEKLTEDDDQTGQMAGTIAGTSTGKKRSIREQEDIVLKEASESLKALRESQTSRGDEHDLVGRYLADQLRLLKNADTARSAHITLMNVVHELIRAENQTQSTFQVPPLNTMQTPVSQYRSGFLRYHSRSQPSSPSPLTEALTPIRPLHPFYKHPTCSTSQADLQSRSQSPFLHESVTQDQ